jgi:hypothetical protein
VLTQRHGANCAPSWIYTIKLPLMEILEINPWLLTKKKKKKNPKEKGQKFWIYHATCSSLRILNSAFFFYKRDESKCPRMFFLPHLKGSNAAT